MLTTVLAMVSTLYLFAISIFIIIIPPKDFIFLTASGKGVEFLVLIWVAPEPHAEVPKLEVLPRMGEGEAVANPGTSSSLHL